MNRLTDLLPPRARALLYAGVYLVGVLLLATQAAYLALGEQPAALTAALAAYGVISAPTAALAAANVTPTRTPKTPPRG